MPKRIVRDKAEGEQAHESDRSPSRTIPKSFDQEHEESNQPRQQREATDPTDLFPHGTRIELDNITACENPRSYQLRFGRQGHCQRDEQDNGAGHPIADRHSISQTPDGRAEFLISGSSRKRNSSLQCGKPMTPISPRSADRRPTPKHRRDPCCDRSRP